MLADARRACKVAVVEVGEYHCEELVDVPQRPTVAAMYERHVDFPGARAGFGMEGKSRKIACWPPEEFAGLYTALRSARERDR